MLMKGDNFVLSTQTKGDNYTHSFQVKNSIHLILQKILLFPIVKQKMIVIDLIYRLFLDNLNLEVLMCYKILQVWPKH